LFHTRQEPRAIHFDKVEIGKGIHCWAIGWHLIFRDPFSCAEAAPNTVAIIMNRIIFMVEKAGNQQARARFPWPLLVTLKKVESKGADLPQGQLRRVLPTDAATGIDAKYEPVVAPGKLAL